MRKRHVLALLALAAVVCVSGLTWHWTHTPHGRLDWRAAPTDRVLPHGFLSIRFFPQRSEALARTADFVQRLEPRRSRS